MTHSKRSNENDIIVCPLDAYMVPFNDMIDLVCFIVDDN